MDITLEKVELVMDRTGVSYAEAKDALEKCEGSVVDAIIAIEESIDKEFDAIDGPGLKDSPVFQKMKDIVDKGNITKIVVKKNGKTYVNFPVTIGVAGAIIVPWVVIVGVVAAIGYQCEITFVDENGQEIDINGKVVGMYEQAKEAAKMTIDKKDLNEAVDTAKEYGKKAVEKGKEVIDELTKDGGTFEKISDATIKANDKFQEYADKSAKKVEEVYNKVTAPETIDEFKKTAGEYADKAVDAAKVAVDKAKEVIKK